MKGYQPPPFQNHSRLPSYQQIEYPKFSLLTEMQL